MITVITSAHLHDSPAGGGVVSSSSEMGKLRQGKVKDLLQVGKWQSWYSNTKMVDY